MRLEPVESLADPRLADYRGLRDGELRDRHGRFVVEGRLGVRRLLARSRFRPRSVLATPAAVESLRDVLAPLDERTPVFVAERRLLCEVVGYAMHRGCVAAAERGAEPAPEALCARIDPRSARVLVLEDVTNPDNVGAIFRNAWAFGADAVWLTRRCADPLYRKAVRVSMGGTLFVPWARIDDAGLVAERLRARGLRVLALTPDPRAAALPAVAPSPPGRGTALLLGGEEAGLFHCARPRAGAAAP